MSDASSSDARPAEGPGSPGSKPEAAQTEVLSGYDQALELLRMQGASAAAAERALKATAEHQPSDATRSETKGMNSNFANNGIWCNKLLS